MFRLAYESGGITGTMHVLLALDAEHEVLHIERDSRPLCASIRNFGPIWVSYRAAGLDARRSLARKPAITMRSDKEEFHLMKL